MSADRLVEAGAEGKKNLAAELRKVYLKYGVPGMNVDVLVEDAGDSWDAALRRIEHIFGAAFPKGGHVLTAEQMEDVRRFAYEDFEGPVNWVELHDVQLRLRALFPATEPAEEVKEPRRLAPVNDCCLYKTPECFTGHPAPAVPAEEETKAERDSEGIIRINGGRIVALSCDTREMVQRWFDIAKPGSKWQRDYAAALDLFDCEAASSPVVPAPTETDTNPAGLTDKYIVRRIDGSDAEGGRNFGRRYFVLSYDSDPHARAALAAYAASCETEYPELAADLRARLGEKEAAAPTETAEEHRVHNHGPAEGRGLECPQMTVDKKLVGFCIAPELWKGPAAPTETGQWERINKVPGDVTRIRDCEGDLWVKSGGTWLSVTEDAFVDQFAPFVSAEEKDA